MKIIAAAVTLFLSTQVAASSTSEASAPGELTATKAPKSGRGSRGSRDSRSGTRGKGGSASHAPTTSESPTSAPTLCESAEECIADLNATRDTLDVCSFDLNATQSELNGTESDLALARDELGVCSSDLNATQSELNATDSDLTATRVELDGCSSDLSATASDLNDTRSDLAAAEASLNATQSELNATLSELAFCQSDKCASNPCLNDGTCFSGSSHYTCTCPTGVIGDDCQTIAPTSCLDYLMNGDATSGIKTVYPSGASGASYEVYCDQTADDGGWMLLYSYNHTGGDNDPLVDGTIPTDPIDGYSHVHVEDLDYDESDIQDVRFYCETSNPNQNAKIHFKTNNAIVKDIAFNGNQAQAGNSVGAWTNNYTVLPGGYNANLPAATDRVFLQTAGGFWSFPFYNEGDYHWGIRGNGNRWECDDYPQGPQFDTKHNVYVRI